VRRPAATETLFHPAAVIAVAGISHLLSAARVPRLLLAEQRHRRSYNMLEIGG
jgi:hypothetical protein